MPPANEDVNETETSNWGPSTKSSSGNRVANDAPRASPRSIRAAKRSAGCDALNTDVATERIEEATVTLLAMAAVGRAGSCTRANGLPIHDDTHATVGDGLAAWRLRVRAGSDAGEARSGNCGLAQSALANPAAAGVIRIAPARAVRKTRGDALIRVALLSRRAIGVLAALSWIEADAIAKDRGGGATDLFPNALAVATRIAAADCLAVRAAIGTAFGVACWTAAGVATRGLLAGTSDRRRGWSARRASRCRSIASGIGSDRGRASDPERGLDQRAAGCALREETGETVETKVIHEDRSRYVRDCSETPQQVMAAIG